MIRPSENSFSIFKKKLKMNFSKFLLPLLLIALSTTSYCQIPFQEENVDYKYNINGELHIDHQLHFMEDSVLVFLSLLIKSDNNIEKGANLQAKLIYKKDYQATVIEKEQPIILTQHFLAENNHRQIFSFKLPASGPNKLVELHLDNDFWDNEFIYDINLKEELDYKQSGLVLYSGKEEKPTISHYFKNNTPLKIKHLSDQRKEIWVYYYDVDFPLAIPPMIVDNDNVTRSLNVTETIRATTDSTMTFNKEGLYFIQTDTSSLEGISFRIQNEPFPKIGTYENLVKPLKYIATKTENEELSNNKDLKTAFENFWITATKSPLLAQNTIKQFYNRAAEANFYFTGYREGWKTDMGMIYIIYGSPDKVYKHEEFEQWIFNQNVNMPAIRFTFVKIKNVFSNNHFALVRDRKFDKHWFRAVELWRKGKR